MPIRNYEYIEIKGNQMSDSVLKALPDIETSVEPPIRAVSDFFDYPLRESFPLSLEQAKREARAAEQQLADGENTQGYKGTRRLDNLQVQVWETGLRLRTAQDFYSDEEHPATTPIEHHALRIGDAVFVSVPGEIFSEIGLRIKQGSSFKKTFCIGISNGYSGYLPSEKEFIEGGYEIDGCIYSSKAEKKCIEYSLEMIGRVER